MQLKMCGGELFWIVHKQKTLKQTDLRRITAQIQSQSQNCKVTDYRLLEIYQNELT